LSGKEILSGEFMNEADIYAIMRPRKICICKAVTLDMIHDAIRKSGGTFEEVQAITHCSTGCGTCEGRVRGIIQDFVTARTASSEGKK